ncbi:MAG TPA: ribonuclease domain-containing protein, partial [Cellulomonadaceae bacterium]|nr:ribonuclease domain-containing protein [Cellulomonadaceae bacterium]
ARTASVDPETGLRWIEVAYLPLQGRAVLALIDKGGPYPYSQDGGTFTNAERLLPLKAKGFYTEYTVKLPSSSDRGPVRIIMGGKGQWYFWTDDHYASFSRIRR